MDKGKKEEERKEGKREGREENGVSQLLNGPSATKLRALHGMGVAGEPGARVLPGFTRHILCGHGKVRFLLFISLV